MLAFLANAALYILPFLAIITLIVVIHELGHFLVARACGAAVKRFSVGFGRAIVAFHDRWGVEWRIGWLPLGGYCMFAGDENVASVPDEDDLESMRRRIQAREGPGAERRYFAFKPLWQRALIVFAGPATNLLLSVFLFATLVGAMGETVFSMKVMEVLPSSAAARAGLLPGDVILGADGRRLASFEALHDYVQDRPGTPMRLMIARGGRELVIPVTPSSVDQPSLAGGVFKVGQIGVAPTATRRAYTPFQALGRGTELTWSIVERTGHYVGRMIEGKAGWPFSGFIGTAHVAGALTKEAVDVSQANHINLALTLAAQYLYLAAFLSTSIGLVNLLPIPVLDGGHLLFYAYEAVARRPLAISIQAAGYRVGLALLIGLMLFATWNDLQRLQVFHFLGALFS
jgi:regulator of sigma E protease